MRAPRGPWPPRRARFARFHLLADLLFVRRAHEVLGGDGPRFRRDEAVDPFFLPMVLAVLLQSLLAVQLASM